MNHYFTLNGTHLIPVTSITMDGRSPGPVSGRFCANEWILDASGDCRCVIVREDGMVFFCDRCELVPGGPGQTATLSAVVTRCQMAEYPEKIRRAICATEHGNP